MARQGPIKADDVPTVPALALERRRRLRPHPPSAAASPAPGAAVVDRQRRRFTCARRRLPALPPHLCQRRLLTFGSYQGSSLSRFLDIMNVILVRVSDLG